MPRKSTWLQNSLYMSQLALGSEHEGHIPSHTPLPEFTGTKIGHWEIDPETKMPKLVLDKDFLEEKEAGCIDIEHEDVTDKPIALLPDANTNGTTPQPG